MWTLGCALCLLCVAAGAAASLEDEVRTLRGQVEALLEHRQQDYRLLEESLRRELDKNSELADLKEQLNALREEVSSARGQQQKNDHLTVQWLQTAVSELRGEVAELSASRNASAELLRGQQTDARLQLLSSDVASLRNDLQQLRADQEGLRADLQMLRQDARAAAAHRQTIADACTDAREQADAVHAEWSTTLKHIKKSIHNGNTIDVSTPPRLLEQSASHGSRHQRLLRKQLQGLEGRLRHLEKETSSRVAALEASGRGAAKALFNATRKMAAVDKVHHSLLQLLEAVQSLENKVDRSLPDLQREISKMEFSVAQLTSASALLKEDSENSRASLKALSGGLEAMQGKVAALATVANCSDDDERERLQEARLQTLEQQLMATQPPTVVPSNKSVAVQLVQELSNVQKQYQQIVSRLPTDCTVVNGPPGLYMLAPDHGHPVLAECDAEGWTVVQRRTDGSQDFNHKWAEYAAGFGSPSGEFWLGNEAIHSLTAANCSSLRIDLRDIYGNAWRAEYGDFHVGPAEDGYRLHVGGYSGNCSDALDYQNRMQFSAADVDHDISNTHCAANYEGGWWFSHCQHANLNGRYNLGLTWFDAAKNEWIAVAWSEMKVRRKSDCSAHA